MPCNCEYLNADDLEIEISRVYCLLEEIRTGKPVNPESERWNGYHPRVYNKVNRKRADRVVAKLCDILDKTTDLRLSRYSLEMQTWWRDHQKADRARLAKELKEDQQKALVESAQQKLSAEELAALKKWFLK